MNQDPTTNSRNTPQNTRHHIPTTPTDTNHNQPNTNQQPQQTRLPALGGNAHTLEREPQPYDHQYMTPSEIETRARNNSPSPAGYVEIHGMPTYEAIAAQTARLRYIILHPNYKHTMGRVAKGGGFICVCLFFDHERWHFREAEKFVETGFVIRKFLSQIHHGFCRWR